MPSPEEIQLAERLAESTVVTFSRMSMGEDEAIKIMNDSVRIFTKVMVESLSGADRLGLFVPVALTVEGRERGGCILTLSDRAIFAWSEGAFRRKTFSATVPYDTITHIEEGTMATDSNPESEALRVKAEHDWVIRFSEGFGVVPKWLHGILNGAITFRHHESEPEPS